MYRSHIPRAMAAGFVGTLVATLTMIVLSMTGYPDTSRSEFFGGMLYEMQIERFSYAWWMTMLWHFNFGAVLFPHIYVLFVGRELPGPAWQRGLLMGAGLWLIAEVVFMPLFGMGLFGSALEHPAAAAFAALLVHAIYGVILGAGTGEIQSAREKLVDYRAAHGLHPRH